MKPQENTKTLSYSFPEEDLAIASDPVLNYMTKDQLKKAMESAKKNMECEAKNLNFIEAVMYRDEMRRLEKLMDKK